MTAAGALSLSHSSTLPRRWYGKTRCGEGWDSDASIIAILSVFLSLKSTRDGFSPTFNWTQLKLAQNLCVATDLNKNKIIL
jgi:hypothetical protein